jgi:phytanoyl-CoA hydroxylase
MGFQRYREQFTRDGFVIVPGFLDAAALGMLRENIERYIRDVVPSLPPSQALYVDRERPDTLKQLQGMSGDPFFETLRGDPHWLALARDLLGEEVHAHEPEWFDKPPGAAAPTPPHQDNYYFNLTPPNVLTIWVALDVVDEENGCVRCLPGSHLRGVRPHGASAVLGFSQGITDYGPEDRAREEPLRLQPGDAAVHHGLTVHRADPNRSAHRRRRAFALVTHGAGSRRDEAAYAEYLAALARQRQTLGVG